MLNDTGTPSPRSIDDSVELSPSIAKESALDIEEKPTLDDPTVDGLRRLSGDYLDNSEPTKLRADGLVKKLSHILGQENAPRRELGVVFSELRVTGIGRTSISQPTVLSPYNYSELLNDYLRPPVRDIISGFTGVIKPGEMLLVLGRPNAGCTTLLKALANDHGVFHSVEGDLSFGGFSSKEIDQHYRGDVLYCSEEDKHFATLTVQETLSLSATLRALDTIDTPLDSYASLAVDYLMEALGLMHTKKTLVGDAGIRGISGGEKRRASIGELLAGRPCIGCWDNVTRGLDASNAIELIHLMRVITQAFNLTTIVSLYQAGDALYDQFDKVCLLYEGKMAYFGPASQARQYFVDLGYSPAPRQTTPDFLLSVTDPNARLTHPDINNPPSTASQFAEHFRASPLGSDNEAQVSSYRAQIFQSLASKPRFSQGARSGRGHSRLCTWPTAVIAPLHLQVSTLLRRQAQRLKGNINAVILNILFFVLQAVVVGTMFLKLPETTAAFFSRGGVLFFALLFASLMAFTEIPLLYVQRPIVLKHKKAAIYHPWVEALSYILIDLSLNLVTMLLFTLALYFLSGLQRSAGQFFIFFLFIYLVGMVMKIWFRLLAAVFQSKDAASSLAGVTILVTSLYTGYYIPRQSMVPALRWLSHLNPFLYGFEALMSNEFRSLSGLCTSLVPQGPGYENITLENQVCPVVGAVSGQPSVSGSSYLELSYGFAFSHTWRNLGIILGFTFCFLAGLLALSQTNTRSSHELSVTRFVRPDRFTRRLCKRKPKDDEEKALELNDIAEKRPELAHGSGAMHSEHVFSFDHISYTVPLPGNREKRLLDDISGYVSPGKLTALMGESGAGKTTLLNLLAMRHSVGNIEGSRQIGGAPLPVDFPRQIGYCEQIDTHLETATVREALLFSARMRQPFAISKADKEDHVELCLQLCDLQPYRDAVLGSLNLELRKRVSIAVELAAKPRYILFLDEPTSGLDSQSAWAIVSLLRKLANAGQAILCTIHQPSAELFQVFDKVLLLHRGGQTVYFGDIGQDSRKLIKYFERYSLQSCGPKENPAEYMFSSLRSPPHDASDWAAAWKDSPDCACLRDEIGRFWTNSHDTGTKLQHQQFATPWLYQVSQLTLRTTRHYWRDPKYVWAKLLMNVAGGLLIGFSFFKIGNSQQDSQNKLFATYMALMICAPACLQLQPLFISMRTIYQLREMPSKMYSWSALVTSQLLVETPWNMVSSFLFFMCWYWPVGFSSSRAGYTVLLYCVALPLYYTSLAQAAAAMASSVEIAGLLFALFFSLLMTFNGVLQPFALLGWWKWMYQLSPFTYVVEGLLGQAIGRQPIVCSELEITLIQPPRGQTCAQFMGPYLSDVGGYITNPQDAQDCQFCANSTTDQFLLAAFNMRYSRHWVDLGILMAFVFFNVFAIYGFTFLRYQQSGIPVIFRRRTGL